MFHQRPAVVVHAVAFVHKQLAQVSRRHVGRDLHHFAHAVLAEDFNDLQENEMHCLSRCGPEIWEILLNCLKSQFRPLKNLDRSVDGADLKVRHGLISRSHWKQMREKRIIKNSLTELKRHRSEESDVFNVAFCLAEGMTSTIPNLTQT